MRGQPGKLLWLLLASCGWLLGSPAALACPFCSAVSQTFTEEIGGSDVAVIARLVSLPPKDQTNDSGSATNVPKAKFEIVEVLKGADKLTDAKKLETIYFGNKPVGEEFLLIGIEPPEINWATPIHITERGHKYLKSAIELPKDGADRLAFFQDFLEDADEMLARDAYDEFAKTPYSGVVGLKDRMQHDKLLTWIKDPQIPASRRRLYFTMLGVCGTKDDLPKLEEMITSKHGASKSGLDALIASYLTLAGPDGMTLIEDTYLKNDKAEYVDTYAAIMALRFHGQEESIIPKPRLIKAIRLVLNRPQIADLVIPDLARWEDWDSMDTLVKLFKDADDDTAWVRVPVVKFLQACPLDQAKASLKELEKIDPETVRRASVLSPFGGAPVPPAKRDDSAAAAPAESVEPVVEAPTSTPSLNGLLEPFNSKSSDTNIADNQSSATESPAVSPKSVSVQRPTGGEATPRTGVKMSSGQRANARGPQRVPQTPEFSVGQLLGGFGLVSLLLCGAFYVIVGTGQRVMDVPTTSNPASIPTVAPASLDPVSNPYSA